ncbi:hypothetical protein C8J57DRAFT_1501402 [Mycena rebaudengoi]|nr:hypothetical protein C8J57DRAFT_1501402 [Mycena rebaudengoi]
MVFRFQGIISKVELQPGDVSKFDHITAINISQAIELVGLSSDNFKQCMASTKNIHQFFSGHFDGVTMASWDTDDQKHGSRLRPSTRFFTSTSEDPKAVPVPMGAGVDLLGMLKKFESTHLLHTESNVVSYFKRGTNPVTKEAVYDTTFPGTFRVGDIVEVHGSFVAFTAKKGKEMRMQLLLQSVTLLDSSFTKSANLARNAGDSTINTNRVQLKRRTPYESEDNSLNVAQKRFKELAVGDGSETRDP